MTSESDLSKGTVCCYICFTFVERGSLLWHKYDHIDGKGLHVLVVISFTLVEGILVLCHRHHLGFENRSMLVTFVSHIG